VRCLFNEMRMTAVVGIAQAKPEQALHPRAPRRDP
jgi:hypothetical protein